MDEYGRDYRISGQTKNARQFKSYIDENYLKQINIFELSQELHYDHRYINAAFKKCYGMSIIDYVNLLRIRYACQIMITLEDNIGSIYPLFGFKSHETFTRGFMKVIGTTPDKYRRENKPKINESTPLIDTERRLTL